MSIILQTLIGRKVSKSDLEFFLALTGELVSGKGGFTGITI